MKRPPRTYCGPLLFVLVMTCPPIAMAQTIWVEGERPARSTMNRHPWWYDQVKKDQLSGGDWISNFSEEKEGEAEYALRCAQSGPLRLLDPRQPGPGPARLLRSTRRRASRSICTPTCSTRSTSPPTTSPTFASSAGRKSVSSRSLAGRHTVRFRFYSKPQHHGALDAFVFTTEPFSAQRYAEAGQGGRLAAATGTWPFLPERDAFRADALLDLARAQREGRRPERVRAAGSSDGESFVLGDGTPARFWAVTTYVQRDRSIEDLAHHARFLAKRGVNMVRLHGHHGSQGEGRSRHRRRRKGDRRGLEARRGDEERGDLRHDQPVLVGQRQARARRNGESTGWPENEAPFGLLFFNPKLQEGYKAWLKALLDAAQPLHGHSAGEGPRTGDHPASERG